MARKCKHCGQPLNSDTKVCPHCGEKTPRSIFTRWWLWVLVAVLVFTAIAESNTVL